MHSAIIKHAYIVQVRLLRHNMVHKYLPPHHGRTGASTLLHLWALWRARRQRHPIRSHFDVTGFIGDLNAPSAVYPRYLYGKSCATSLGIAIEKPGISPFNVERVDKQFITYCVTYFCRRLCCCYNRDLGSGTLNEYINNGVCFR